MEDNLPDAVKEELAKADEERRRAGLTELERLREDEPAMQEAWERINLVRAMVMPSDKDSAEKPRWEQIFNEIANGKELDPNLKDAWDQYYVLKGLYGVDE